MVNPVKVSASTRTFALVACVSCAHGPERQVDDVRVTVAASSAAEEPVPAPVPVDITTLPTPDSVEVGAFRLIADDSEPLVWPEDFERTQPATWGSRARLSDGTELYSVMALYGDSTTGTWLVAHGPTSPPFVLYRNDKGEVTQWLKGLEFPIRIPTDAINNPFNRRWNSYGALAHLGHFAYSSSDGALLMLTKEVLVSTDDNDGSVPNSYTVGIGTTLTRLDPSTTGRQVLEELVLPGAGNFHPVGLDVDEEGKIVVAGLSLIKSELETRIAHWRSSSKQPYAITHAQGIPEWISSTKGGALLGVRRSPWISTADERWVASLHNERWTPVLNVTNWAKPIVASDRHGGAWLLLERFDDEYKQNEPSPCIDGSCNLPFIVGTNDQAVAAADASVLHLSDRGTWSRWRGDDLPDGELIFAMTPDGLGGVRIKGKDGAYRLLRPGAGR